MYSCYLLCECSSLQLVVTLLKAKHIIVLLSLRCCSLKPVEVFLNLVIQAINF
jgi:hypothetical protein